jgi:hypothetical protein
MDDVSLLSCRGLTNCAVDQEVRQMARGSSPTLRKRRLVSELRRLREVAGLTIEEVGERL